MKKLWFISALSFWLILLAGCNNKPVETLEIIDEENIVEVVEEENIEEEIVEEVEEEVIDWEKWNLLAFNWKEVDWDYKMTITNDGKLYTKFFRFPSCFFSAMGVLYHRCPDWRWYSSAGRAHPW